MNRCALLMGFGVLAFVDDSPDSSALEKNRRPRRVASGLFATPTNLQLRVLSLN
jgi:hypothetical protein